MKKSNKYDTLETAFAGGVIGAALGALFTDKKESTIITSLIGVALGATYSAFKESQDLGSQILYEEDGNLYRSLSQGKREFVKELPKNTTHVPKTFTLG